MNDNSSVHFLEQLKIYSILMSTGYFFQSIESETMQSFSCDDE